MTATAASLAAFLDKRNGYKETRDAQHPDGNVTDVWAELEPSLQGAYWCAAGVSFDWKHAGGGFPAIDRPYGFVSCNDGYQWAKKHGLWITSGYSFGDTLIFDWKGDGVPDHTGHFIKELGNNQLRTFENNTTPEGGSGAQWNGGGSYYRTRTHGGTLMGAIKTSVFLAGGSNPPAPHPQPAGKTNPFAASAAPCQQGAKGDQVRFVQWAIAVPVDGVFGPQTTTGVKNFQHFHPACGGADGIVGPKTLSVLKTVTH